MLEAGNTLPADGFDAGTIESLLAAQGGSCMAADPLGELLAGNAAADERRTVSPPSFKTTVRERDERRPGTAVSRTRVERAAGLGSGAGRDRAVAMKASAVLEEN